MSARGAAGQIPLQRSLRNAALTRRANVSNVPPMKSVKVPALELFLHEMIPLAKAMGVGVEVSDDRALVLTAPNEQDRKSTRLNSSQVALSRMPSSA